MGDFLTRCTQGSLGAPLSERVSPQVAVARIRVQKSDRRHTGEDEREGNGALPARGQCISWFVTAVTASFTLVEMHQKRETRSCSSRNWREHYFCRFRKETFGLIFRFSHSYGPEGFSKILRKRPTDMAEVTRLQFPDPA